MNKQLGRLLLIFVAGVGRERAARLRFAGAHGGPGTVTRSHTGRQRRSNLTPELSPNAGLNVPPVGATQSWMNSSALIALRRPEAEQRVAAARVLVRFLLAGFLAMLLAFRWRRGLSITKRNPYVAQTQILLAVVAAAMMMIVGDSAARAFGIFAAASLVRFRTNIRDPKETTVLLVCLGVGLACGVGRLDMAFILAALRTLHSLDSGALRGRANLPVNGTLRETRKVDQTNEILKRVFAQHKFDIELRELDREDC